MMRKRIEDQLATDTVPAAAKAAALHDAAIEGDITAIAAALDAGADVNEVGGKGEATALYYAVLARSMDAARLLIGRGADVRISWGPGQETVDGPRRT